MLSHRPSHRTAPVETHRRTITPTKGSGFIARQDSELLKRVREARTRLGAELVEIDGKPRFIDEAEVRVAA